MEHKSANVLKPFRIFYDKDLGIATPFSNKLRYNV